MRSFFALCAALVMAACADPYPQPEYFRDRFPPWDLKTAVAFHVDPEVTVSRDMIADGAALLDQFGYPLEEVDDPAVARLRFRQMPGNRACTENGDWMAYAGWCGEIYFCPRYVGMVEPQTVAHEISHALGVWHVPTRCTGDEADTKYGPACGPGIMNPALDRWVEDFTIADAAAFYFHQIRDDSIFSPTCVQEYRRRSGLDPY